MLEFIFYVSDQERSKKFYTKILNQIPILDEPNMTEFEIASNVKLGLLNADSAEELLGENISIKRSDSFAKSELYLIVESALESYERALLAGAKELSEPALRNWGDFVGYIADYDGNIVAFAERMIP